MVSDSLDKKCMKIALGVGILALTVSFLCHGKKSQKIENLVTSTQPISEEVQTLPETGFQGVIYTVKKGDYPSKIIGNEFGLNGKDIYDAWLEIQANNNLGPERDISKVVNGKLVPGKDGFTDLIYPGERINLGLY